MASRSSDVTPPLAEQLDDVMGGPGVDQRRLALGRPDQDGITLPHVQDAEGRDGRAEAPGLPLLRGQ